MKDIILLDRETADQIAAGEVIERPSSVVKELVENSIDAGADLIEVEVRGGGIEFLRVADNGTGMTRDNALRALERHATSKIRSPEDLLSVCTLGFRGEALPSIASVSRFRLRTRPPGELAGTEIQGEGGQVKGCCSRGCPEGTEILVEDLFYNTPARRKFLKSPAAEAALVSEVITRFALARPDISLAFSREGRLLFKSPGNDRLLEVLSLVYGREKARYYFPLEGEENSYRLTGYGGYPSLARSNRQQQLFYVNGRFIRSRLVSRALEKAYGSLLSRNTYPAALLFLEIDPVKLDVNVHPAKIQVRFSEEKALARFIYQSLQGALQKQGLAPRFPLKEKRGRETREYQQETLKGLWPGNWPDPETAGAGKPGGGDREGDLTPAAPGDRETRDNLCSPGPRSMPGAPAPRDGTRAWETRDTGVTVSRDIPVNPENPGLPPALEPPGSPALDTGEGFPGRRHLAGSHTREKVIPPVTEPGDTGGDDICPRVGPGTGPGESPGPGNTGKRPCPVPYKVLAQFLGSYIIMQQGRELVLLDQHAAHERIMYEKFQQHLEGGGASQEITPLVLEVPVGTTLRLEESKDIIIKTGFNVEEFGNNSIIVRSVPHFLKDIYSVKVIEEMVYALLNEGERGDKARQEAVVAMACRAACKANQGLSRPEMDSLVQQLFKTANPFTCPHGRPTMVVLGETELEKLFHRRS